jgi:hypothetical protein
MTSSTMEISTTISSIAAFCIRPSSHSPTPPTMELPSPAELPPAEAGLPPPEEGKKTRKRRGPSIGRKRKQGDNNTSRTPKTPKQGTAGVVPPASTPSLTVQAVRSRTPRNGIHPNYTDTSSPEKQHTTRDYQSRRIAIGYIYMHTLDAPKRSEWEGKDGTIADICTRLGLAYNQRQAVRKCLTRIVECLKTGVEYDGSRKDMGESTRTLLIPDCSVEMQIIADSVGMGLSISKATELVNEHRKENDVEEVGRSTVFEVYKSLNL